MDTMGILWATEEPAADFGVDVPSWIEQDITANDVAAIVQGGCDSGAYMPAVTYHQARATMAEHGDDVLDFLEQWDDLDRFTLEGQSWSGFACSVLSAAVEAWAHSIHEELAEAITEEMEEEEGNEDEDEAPAR